MIDKIGSSFELDEIRKIEEYCLEAQTQILYLMIVQMIGFSRDSEEKLEVGIQDVFNNLIASKLETYNGIQLKQINRSVLAAFTDPTSAVRAALEIQFEAENAGENHDIKLQLKIGIHTGQALINNKFNQLVFNNHINFTSNLESLVETGHIYLSDHVYIGAGNWLDQQSPYNIVHKKHGRYYLQDVKENAEIYEVSNKKIQSLKAPDSAKWKKTVSFRRKIAYGITAVLVIIFMLSKCQKTSVYLQDFSQDEVFLNQKHKQLTLGNYTDNKPRKIISRLQTGKHILYYDDNPGKRYYATINVKKGKNELKPRFRKQKLPRMQKNIALNTKNKFEDVALGNGRWSYAIYNKNNDMISHDAEFDISVRGEKLLLGGTFNYTVRWRFDLDGARVNSGEKSFSTNTHETINFYKDKLHFIDFEISIEDNKANAALISVFADHRK